MAKLDDDPIEFSLAFVAALRKRTDLSQAPSLRTAVAIPKFLSARLFRKGSLTARDYVEAAVYLSPYEDQSAAFETARELLFPKQTPKEEESAKDADGDDDTDAVVSTSKSNVTAPPSLSILDDLAGLNLGDIGSLDLNALDKALDQKTAEAIEMKSLDLVSSLASSDDERDNAVAALVNLVGGPTELEVEGAHTKDEAIALVVDRLKGRAGSLTPEEAAQAGRAHLDDAVLDDVKLPWERAGIIAGALDRDAVDFDDFDPTDPVAHEAAADDDGDGDDGDDRASDDGANNLRALLAGALDDGSAHELGRMLAFLAPHRDKLGKGHETFRQHALSSAAHLGDWAEMLDGLGEFVAPPAALVTSSARENLPGALAAADRMQAVFKAGVNARAKLEYDASVADEMHDDDDSDDDDSVDSTVRDDSTIAEASNYLAHLKPAVFEAWAASLTEPPSLEFLLGCVVDCERWRTLVDGAFRAEVVARLEAARELGVDARAEHVRAVLPIGKRLRATDVPLAKRLGAELATIVLVVVGDKARFLPLLDALIDLRLLPHDNGKVVEAGMKLGISEEDIWARLSAPLEQLRYLIEAKVTDPERYRDLVGKLEHVPKEMLEELVRICLDRLAHAKETHDDDERTSALLGLAILLAVTMGPAAALMPADVVTTAVGYKGVGGGENLLVQWFEHKGDPHLSTRGDLRARIKALAKAALLDAAFAWVHKGTGSADRGLVPQSRSRPFRGGDEVDDLDIEATLDAVIGAGKSLDQIGDDDLMVSDTSAGRAGFGVLIDISGSMSGKDLAVCAIGVVMLLGKLRPEEVAIALFESNTHVVKRFHETTDLDDVADRLLELQATGGTRVDAALQFVVDEFTSQPEHERRLLFLLSDFCFFESRDALLPLAHRLRDLDVGYLGASHGSVCRDCCDMFVAMLGGYTAKLSSMAKLPEVLLQALTVVGEGRLK